MEQPQAPQGVPNLAAGQATATAQVQIVRAGTGKVENYTLTFTPLAEQPAPADDKEAE